jgi:hypothetical protein
VLLKPPHVAFVETVPHSRMPERLADSDLLLLPFNFDDGSVRFIRYSWPTKMPEFMISGRPILLYGPADTAFGEYARRESWACVVDRRDPRLLSEALVGLMGDYGRRRDLTVRARELVLKEQNLHKTRRHFQGLIRQAV